MDEETKPTTGTPAPTTTSADTNKPADAKPTTPPVK